MSHIVRPSTLPAKFALFSRVVYAPGIHVGYSVLVFVVVDGLSRLLSHTLPQGRWAFGTHALIAISVLFLLLLQIRAADEIKDFEYDKVFNPERPLVTGALTTADMWTFIAASSSLALMLSSLLGEMTLAIVFFTSIYTVTLIFVERMSERVRDGLFLNMLVTFPVNLLCNAVVYTAYCNQTAATFEFVALAQVLFVPALSFLHFEFAKKTSWPQHAVHGKRLYSEVLGTRPALFIIVLLALAAPSSLLLFSPPLETLSQNIAAVLLFVPVIVLAVGLLKFWQIRAEAQTRKPTILAPFAMMTMALFLIATAYYTAAMLNFAF